MSHKTLFTRIFKSSRLKPIFPPTKCPQPNHGEILRVRTTTNSGVVGVASSVEAAAESRRHGRSGGYGRD